MMQCGMFVPAESFCSNVCDGIFTHFKREEDATMKSGKLDEELSRMSEIADKLSPNGVLLCNESFASTNEREGSEIGRQVISALTAERIRVFFVTHLFDLAQGFYAETSNSGLFLRAERLPDQRRTFRVREGEPLPTSYGEDTYRRIFRSAVQPRDGAAVPVPANPNYFGPSDRWAGHVRRYTRERLLEAIASAGFTVERCDAWGFPVSTLYHRYVYDPRLARRGTAPPGRGSYPALAALGLLLEVDRLFVGVERGALGYLVLARK